MSKYKEPISKASLKIVNRDGSPADMPFSQLLMDAIANNQLQPGHKIGDWLRMLSNQQVVDLDNALLKSRHSLFDSQEQQADTSADYNGADMVNIVLTFVVVETGISKQSCSIAEIIRLLQAFGALVHMEKLHRDGLIEINSKLSLLGFINDKELAVTVTKRGIAASIQPDADSLLVHFTHITAKEFFKRSSQRGN